MLARIPDETLQAIRERANIVDIVSAYVSLKRAGRNHLGLCPFHGEKTPSFTVSEERGLFHCFGCGAGGSVFNFLMRIENIDFIDAVRQLAQRVGIELTLTKDSSSRNERERLLSLNEYVQKRYRGSLAGPDGARARSYLEQRGLSAEWIERFGIGFCPRAGTGVVPALTAKPEALRAAAGLGLIATRDDGRSYERLWGRITFPIRDVNGAIVGFGGRAILDQQPKYLNSPESSLFHKGNVLYGIYEAKQAIRERQRIIIVEGYLDAIALVQHGIGEVVASLGTALTATQLKLAKRFAPSIIAFFDGDSAGQKAALRAFETSLEAEVQALGAFLPEGVDPDDFVRNSGVAATQQLLAQAVPLAEYFVAQLSPPANAALHLRVAAAERIAAALAQVRDPLEFGMIAQKAAQRLGVDESIFRELRRGNPRPRPAASSSALPSATVTFRPEELMLLECAVADRTAAETIAARAVVSLFESLELGEAVEEVIRGWQRGEGLAALVDHVSEQTAARISAALMAVQAGSSAERMQMVDNCCNVVAKRALAPHTMKLKDDFVQAEINGDQERFAESAQSWLELARRRKSGDPLAGEKKE